MAEDDSPHTEQLWELISHYVGKERRKSYEQAADQIAIEFWRTHRLEQDVVEILQQLGIEIPGRPHQSATTTTNSIRRSDP